MSSQAYSLSLDLVWLKRQNNHHGGQTRQYTLPWDEHLLDFFIDEAHGIIHFRAFIHSEPNTTTIFSVEMHVLPNLRSNMQHTLASIVKRPPPCHTGMVRQGFADRARRGIGFVNIDFCVYTSTYLCPYQYRVFMRVCVCMYVFVCMHAARVRDTAYNVRRAVRGSLHEKLFHHTQSSSSPVTDPDFYPIDQFFTQPSCRYSSRRVLSETNELFPRKIQRTVCKIARKECRSLMGDIQG